eukprot:2708099-Alexandrium_andersonii.AAC.1
MTVVAGWAAGRFRRVNTEVGQVTPERRGLGRRPATQARERGLPGAKGAWGSAGAFRRCPH